MTPQEEEIVLIKLLRAVGMEENLAKEAYKDFRIKRNAAFINEALNSLEESLRIEALNKLRNLQEPSPENINLVLKEFAEKDSNKPDILGISLKTEEGITQAFFLGILDNATEKNRENFSKEYEKILAQRPELVEIITSYLESNKNV